jgi:hypothetical protein
MLKKIDAYRDELICREKMMEIFQGWNAYAKWANAYRLRKSVLSEINKIDILKPDNIYKS